MIVFFLLLALFVSVLFLMCRWCYWYAFKSDYKRQSTQYDVPISKHRKRAIENIIELMNTPFEDVEITSKDSLKLYARYYHLKDDAPVAIMMHGYRSHVFRDGNGGFKIAKNYGLNILMPDQRAHGKSEGKCITFGVKERYDCLEWVKYLKERFGKNIKIVLIGLSMGASTVMMSADIVPEENVKGIISDCGFSSPKAILTEVATQMKLPPKPAYFLLKIGAIVFGGFNPDEYSAVEALQNTKIPILFIHGEKDDFVPCSMTRECHKLCKSQKQIFTVANASHGVSYYLDTSGYTKTVTEFLDSIF